MAGAMRHSASARPYAMPSEDLPAQAINMLATRSPKPVFSKACGVCFVGCVCVWGGGGGG
jgi:hypothetical protein